ncbi:hypothetical protein ACTWQL_01760 [Pseudalkalibacillus sp. R45]|uniref:hypothetical protein n=1 Tax=Pseudalkalibacillus sp. R45 TaxID=3457433 RepID=UPI003FCE4CC7
MNKSNQRCKRCNGCFCELFSKLRKGTIVQLAVGPNFIEPGDEEEFQFISFDEKTCCVTLRDTDNNVVIFNCERLVAVEIGTGIA